MKNNDKTSWKNIKKVLIQYKKDHTECKDWVVNERGSMREREGQEACDEFKDFLKKIIKRNEKC